MEKIIQTSIRMKFCAGKLGKTLCRIKGKGVMRKLDSKKARGEGLMG